MTSWELAIIKYLGKNKVGNYRGKVLQEKESMAFVRYLSKHIRHNQGNTSLNKFSPSIFTIPVDITAEFPKLELKAIQVYVLVKTSA